MKGARAAMQVEPSQGYKLKGRALLCKWNGDDGTATMCSAPTVECGPRFVSGSIPNAAAAPTGERSLHTGEVVGSIPTAPTISAMKRQ
jgi:hypothetical protein